MQTRPGPLDGASDPFRPVRARSEVLGSHLPDRTSVPEIEAQLAGAIRRYQRAALLFQHHSISPEEYESYLDQIRLLVGRLKGLHEELNDEIDRAKIELAKKQAELKMAEARQKATAVSVARNVRLNGRKQGTVSSEEVTKDESEDSANVAQIEVKRAELQEVGLRVKQYSARDDVIRQILESTQAAVAKIAAKSGEGATSPPAKP
jgi:multidrug resistance efflux pump